ncbi:hypothetical protein RSO01_87020 [Reyranella soli]|uniref:Uncharacterized protein n=1 Tax=Reyranella soli TaxID=1230389 RepID=A0A512NRF1_9HYPH|nr:hypothetical protein RSO01_87020 [Reyranella soli]
MWSMTFATWLGKSAPRIAFTSAADFTVTLGWYISLDLPTGQNSITANYLSKHHIGPTSGHNGS